MRPSFLLSRPFGCPVSLWARPRARSAFVRAFWRSFTGTLATLMLGIGAILSCAAASSALIPAAGAPSVTILLDPPLPRATQRGAPNARLDPGPAAQPYVFKGNSHEDQARALTCLTAAIYYEAASESADGQRAVAQVVLNRVRHPAWPSSICGVIYQGSDLPGCQFSYACDGAMARRPLIASAWARAAQIARRALGGAVFAPVGLATHYHSWTVDPHWTRPLIRTAVIGQHIFYRLPGRASAPAAYSAMYMGQEPSPPAWPGPLAAPVLATQAETAMPIPLNPAPNARPDIEALRTGDVLPAYRASGQWLHD